MKQRKILLRVLLIALSLPLTGYSARVDQTWGNWTIRYYDDENPGDGVTIAGYATHTNETFSGILQIPDTIGGYPVTGIIRLFDSDYSNIDASDVSTVAFTGTSYLKKIGERAFADCANLHTLYLPDSLEEINPEAFSNCTNLKTLNLPGALQAIDRNAFQGSSITNLVLPETVNYVGAGAFDDCTALQRVEIRTPEFPDDPLPTWSDNYMVPVFANCSNLTEVVFADTVKVIPAGALYGCSRVTNIVISDSVTRIDESAFRNCSSLESIRIPDSVTSLGKQAFLSCSNLTEVALSTNLTEISYGAFSASGLIEISIPENITHLDDYAFSGCGELRFVRVPASVETMDQGAFLNCRKLRAVVFEGDYPGAKEYVNYPAAHFPNAENLVLYYFEGASFPSPSWNWYGGTSSLLYSIPTRMLTEQDRQILDWLQWRVESYDEITITNCSTAAYGDLTIPDVIYGFPVTALDNASFEDCVGLTRVGIPSDVFYIGNAAFSGCSNLVESVIPEGIQLIGENTFLFCTSLTNANLPDSIISIGNFAFRGCEALPSISIPDGVKTIGTWAFMGDGSLTEMNLPSSLTSIGYSAFRSCTNLTSIVFPAGVSSIEGYAFTACHNLTSAIFDGDAPSTFGSGVFDSCAENFTIYFYEGATGFTTPTWYGYPCEMLTRDLLTWRIVNEEAWVIDCETTASGGLIIPAMHDGYPVTTVSTQAFYLCTSLKNVAIPDSVTNIQKNAFSYCNSLTNMVISDHVTHLGIGAFSDCGRLTDVTIGQGIQAIAASTFEDCADLASIILPEGLTSIGNDAFKGCEALTNAIIPSTVRTIGRDAFNACKSLKSVVIPEGITTIEDRTFYQCFALESVEMPDSLTTIGQKVFQSCSHLYTVYIPEHVTLIEDYAFYGAVTNATFSGNAPELGFWSLGITGSILTENLYVYFYEGATGFTTPTWEGYNCAMLAAKSPYEAWAEEAFGNKSNYTPAQRQPEADPDGDGCSNEGEFIAGTQPDNGNSIFRVTNMVRTANGIELYWPPVSGRVYSVEWTDSLTHQFQTLNEFDALIKSPCTVSNAPAQGYYRIRVEME